MADVSQEQRMTEAAAMYNRLYSDEKADKEMLMRQVRRYEGLLLLILDEPTLGDFRRLIQKTLDDSEHERMRAKRSPEVIRSLARGSKSTRRKDMIRRAQAETLLKLAEALEDCERNGLTLESDVGEYVTLMDAGVWALDSYSDLSPVTLRVSVATLYPKSEAAE